MRFGLIGYTGHWTTYAPVLKAMPDTVLAGVAPATEEETAGGFDHAPGYGTETRRFDTPAQLLDAGGLDWVQVCCRPDRIPHFTLEALRRGIPVVAEKPLAIDLRTLAELWRASEKIPLVPMHTQRSEPWVAAAKQVVADGAVGRPLQSAHQKTYKWGTRRPDYFRSRATFPGIAPFIGIHAFDWIVWLLGGNWEEIDGWGSTAARPDYPACAANAGFVMHGREQVATLSLDFLRPDVAKSHGNERLRIAGTEGVLELENPQGTNLLLRGSEAPRALSLAEPEDWYVSFVRSLRGDGRCLIPRVEAFRATELALKAQLAADTGKRQPLRETEYR